MPKGLNKKYEIRADAHLFTSDEVLREKKFRQLVDIIKSKEQKLTITIIGGSHSAFSIAWLLLNGPCKLKQFTMTNP